MADCHHQEANTVYMHVISRDADVKNIANMENNGSPYYAAVAGCVSPPFLRATENVTHFSQLE